VNDRPTNEEREAMITEGRPGALEPDEAAELEVLADLLADRSMWAEPRESLEDDVAHAIANATPVRPDASRHKRRWLIASAAAAASIAILLGIVVTRSSAGAEFDARLSATKLAPAAHASAAITRNDAGFHIALDARGLPHLNAGEYYQAWVKNEAGVSVPIGTFSSSDSRVTLWSGVSPEAFPTITVTIESTDNDQSSSGRVVLVGIAHRH
jgi:hypothetical protein